MQRTQRKKDDWNGTNWIIVELEIRKGLLNKIADEIARLCDLCWNLASFVVKVINYL